MGNLDVYRPDGGERNPLSLSNRLARIRDKSVVLEGLEKSASIRMAAATHQIVCDVYGDDSGGQPALAA